MSPHSTITARDAQSLSPPNGKSVINKEHLDLIERTIKSLRAEAAAGTPIDHELIAEFEQKLKELKDKASR